MTHDGRPLTGEERRKFVADVAAGNERRRAERRWNDGTETGETEVAEDNPEAGEAHRMEAVLVTPEEFLQIKIRQAAERER